MTREKYLELFRKYTKGEVKINGIVLTPQIWNINGELVFVIKNPNKVSYSKPALTGYLQEIFLDFHKMIGTHFKSEYGDFELYGPDLYVSKDLYNRLDSQFNDITKLNMGDVKLDVTHKRFDINIVDSDMINIVNYVVPTNCEVLDVEDVYFECDVKYGVLSYELHTKNSRFDEHEKNYMSLDNIIDEFPTFVDNDWQVFYTTTKFLN